MRTRVYGGNWNKAKENGPDPGATPTAGHARVSNACHVRKGTGTDQPKRQTANVPVVSL